MPEGVEHATKPFMAHQSMLDAGQPHGHGRRYYWKSHYLRELGPAASYRDVRYVLNTAAAWDPCPGPGAGRLQPAPVLHSPFRPYF